MSDVRYEALPARHRLRGRANLVKNVAAHPDIELLRRLFEDLETQGRPHPAAGVVAEA